MKAYSVDIGKIYTNTVNLLLNEWQVLGLTVFHEMVFGE